MSQHQQAFLADNADDFGHVALHALNVLMAGNAAKMPAHPSFEPSSLADLNKRLYDAAISKDRDQIWDAVKDIQRADLSNQTIKSAFVTTVARQLGDDWVNDKASFGAVTIGCARLQAVVRHLEDTPPNTNIRESTAQTNCLVVVPKGNQHTLGAVVLTDQLRYAGAPTKLVLGINGSALSQNIAAQPFDAVMISASKGQDIEDLRTLVHSARQGNSPAKIIIGGGILDECRDLVAATGTDYVSQDVREVLDFCARDCCLS